MLLAIRMNLVKELQTHYLLIFALGKPEASITLNQINVITMKMPCGKKPRKPVQPLLEAKPEVQQDYIVWLQIRKKFARWYYVVIRKKVYMNMNIELFGRNIMTTTIQLVRILMH